MSTVKAHTGPVYVLVQCLKWKCGALLPLCDWVRSSFWRRLLKGNIYVIVRIPVIKLQPQSDIKPLGALPLAVSGSWGRALGKKCGAKTWSSNTVNVVSLKKNYTIYMVIFIQQVNVLNWKAVCTGPTHALNKTQKGQDHRLSWSQHGLTTVYRMPL